eukprot:Lithocolla_globosa_v1_NODE_4710_length_1382_cov_7.789751.p2 type:complete len:114 gc:universal NODE_4710_length_1382_cov_7.789751:631-972(+)
MGSPPEKWGGRTQQVGNGVWDVCGPTHRYNHGTSQMVQNNGIPRDVMVILIFLAVRKVRHYHVSLAEFCLFCVLLVHTFGKLKEMKCPSNKHTFQINLTNTSSLDMEDLASRM